MSTEEEYDSKEDLQELLSDSRIRMRQLLRELSKLRKDIYLTEITNEVPRIKIEFHGSFEAIPLSSDPFRLPWAIISPEDKAFHLTAWEGRSSFHEESFESAEEASEILSLLLDTPPCQGLTEYTLLENVDRLQIADFFLFYSEPSLYRSRQCHRFLFKEEKGLTRCLPCGELFQRLTADVKSEFSDLLMDSEEDILLAPPPPKKQSRKRTWDCKHCQESFKSETSFKSHECNEITNADIPFQHFCSICSRQFRFGGTYLDHLFHSHRQNPEGSEIFSNEQHKLRCSSCEEHFDDPRGLERHRSSQHRDPQAATPLLFKDEEGQEDKFECFECARLFPDYSSYTRHRHKMHQVLVGPEGDGPLQSKRCYFCPRHFTRRGKLARHLRERHAEEDLSQLEEIQSYNPPKQQERICDICGKAVLNMSYHKENAHRDRDIFQSCPICGKFIKKISLRGHLFTHKQKSWLCSDCGLGFSHKTYLERHVRIHDPQYKCLPCKFCDKLFGRMDCLQKHLKSAHLGQKDYICSTCGKAFVCKSKLNRHNLVHLNEKNYPCEICSYVCSRLDNLNAHRQKSHGLEKTTTAAVKERTQQCESSNNHKNKNILLQPSSSSNVSL